VRYFGDIGRDLCKKTLSARRISRDCLKKSGVALSELKRWGANLGGYENGLKRERELRAINGINWNWRARFWGTFGVIFSAKVRWHLSRTGRLGKTR
jgi:hypothetical protein